MEAARQYGAFVAAAVVGAAGFALGDYAQVAWALAAVLTVLGISIQAPRWGVLSSALLGFAASAYLLQRKIDPTGASICSATEVVNCDKVNTSAASVLFGLPIALYGVAFFGGVALAALVAKPSPTSRLYQTVGLFSLLGSVYSIWLAYQTYLLGATCPFCLTIYGSCFVLAGTCAFAATDEDEDARRAGPLAGLFANLQKVPGSTSFLVIAATFVVGVLLGQTFVPAQGPATVDEIARRTQQQPRPVAPTPGAPTQPRAPAANQFAGTYGLPKAVPALEGDEPLLGKPTASIQILEFADFGCPHCAQAYPLLHQLVERYPDDVNVRFRVFPLSGACNPAIPVQDRAEVCRAAMASQCATNQGKFWEYAGTLFANQRFLATNAEELITQAASNVGLDLQQLSACMQDPKTLQQVQQDALAGVALQLPGTPSFFVKGLVGDGWVEVCAGPEALVGLVIAKKDGVELPPAAGVCADDGHGH